MAPSAQTLLIRRTNVLSLFGSDIAVSFAESARDKNDSTKINYNWWDCSLEMIVITSFYSVLHSSEIASFFDTGWI